MLSKVLGVKRINEKVNLQDTEERDGRTIALFLCVEMMSFVLFRVLVVTFFVIGRRFVV